MSSSSSSSNSNSNSNDDKINNSNDRNNISININSGSVRSNLVRSFKVMDVLRKANELQQKLDNEYDVAVAAVSNNGNNNTKAIIPERVQVLHLEVGQPETGAPKQVADAAIKALATTTTTTLSISKNSNSNVMGYTDAFGLIELRKRIRQHYIDKYNLVSSMSTTTNDINNNAQQNGGKVEETQPQPRVQQVQVPDISQIVITTGSSGAFLLAFTACFDPGDVVAIASSGYPCYRNILQALGCSIATCPINKEYKLTAFELQNEIIQRRRKTNNNNNNKIKGLILSSPSNPTGSMLTPIELQELCILCNKENIIFISDEIYHGISYGNVPEATALQFATASATSTSSAATKIMMSDNDNKNNDNTSAAAVVAAATFDSDSDVPDDNSNNLDNNNHTNTNVNTDVNVNVNVNVNTNIFIINSFSKYYSMPGWRLGWMIVPQRYVQSINKLQQNMFINAPTISQTAAIECFDNPQTTLELQNHMTKYRTNREIIINVFASNLCQGLSMTHNVAPPDGGFYIYVDLGNENICIYNDNNNNKNGNGNGNIDYGSVTMCDKLLEQYYVAFTPGIDFEDPTTSTTVTTIDGDNDDDNGNGNGNGGDINKNCNLGNRRFRISYAGSTDTIQKAMEKFIHFWNHVWLIELATAKIQVKIEKYIFKNAVTKNVTANKLPS